MHDPKLPVREEALAPITPTVIAVTVEEVYSACESDMAAANTRFRDKVLKVTGVVDRIEVKDMLDIYYITLNNAERNLLQGIRCVFGRKYGPELTKLIAGQTVTVRGRYDGSIMDICIRDCVLVH